MNPDIFFELAIDGESPWWRMLLDGLQFTLGVALWAWLLAMSLGAVIGVIRTLPRPWIARFGDAWVEVFRNVPLIVQFFVWYFVLPGLFLPLKVWVTALDPTQHQFITSILCLGLFTSARIAEQVKAGLQALPTSQRSAGLALGLTEWQTYRYVRLPMAFRIIIPPLTWTRASAGSDSAKCLAQGKYGASAFITSLDTCSGCTVSLSLAGCAHACVCVVAARVCVCLVSWCEQLSVRLLFVCACVSAAPPSPSYIERIGKLLSEVMHLGVQLWNFGKPLLQL